MEKFEIYQNLIDICGNRTMYFYYDEIPVEAFDKLMCGCCGLLLKDCNALKEGEQTTILPVHGPIGYGPELLVIDEHGQVGDYYAFCGKGCYEE